MEVLQILELFDFYQDSERSLQRQIAASATRKTLKTGEFFSHEGDVCAVFAIVGSGSLRVFKNVESGREITFLRVTSGQTCLENLLSTFLKIGSPAFAVDEEEVEAADLHDPRRDRCRTRHGPRGRQQASERIREGGSC